MTYDRVARGHWCPSCSHIVSKAQSEIFNYIKQFYLDALLDPDDILKNKRYKPDVYVPSLNKAIEYDGYFWHKTDLIKNKQYKELKIKLLRINENDYLKDKQKIYLQINNFLNIII